MRVFLSISLWWFHNTIKQEEMQTKTKPVFPLRTHVNSVRIWFITLHWLFLQPINCDVVSPFKSNDRTVLNRFRLGKISPKPIGHLHRIVSFFNSIGKCKRVRVSNDRLSHLQNLNKYQPEFDWREKCSQATVRSLKFIFNELESIIMFWEKEHAVLLSNRFI